VIKIGEILTESGSLASQGPEFGQAATLAVNDMNQRLQAAGRNIQFELVVEDDQSTPSVSKTQYQALVASGVQLIVGPSTSSAISLVYPLAAEDHVVVISQTASSPSLDINKPYVYRMVGSDANQASALTKMLKMAGYKNAVIAYRTDDWGTPTAQALQSDLQAASIQSKMVGYPATGYVMSGIAGSVANAVSAFGTNGTTVVLLSFEDDGIALLSAAASYPVLSQVQWFSGEGMVGSSAVTGQVASFVEKVNFEAVSPGFSTNSPVYHTFAQEANSTGNTAALVAQAPYSYDAVMVGMLAILIAGNNGTAINAVLPSVAASYDGVTGPCSFNQYNDRAFQNYFINTYNIVGGVPGWYVLGSYDSASDTITMYASPQSS
jgi:branched-chain amino acid transport system substrate-binding protein